MAKTRAAKIGKVIRERLKYRALKVDAPDHKIAIACSGGIDSCSILAAYVSVGLNPTVVSYTPDTHESTDFKCARQSAENLGLPFAPALVSMKPKRLERDMRTVIGMGYVKKMEVESLIPMLHIANAARRAGAKALVTGDQAGGFFILSRWAGSQYDKAHGITDINYNLRSDTNPERMDWLRARFIEHDQSNIGAVKQIAKLNQMACDVPYLDDDIIRAFHGSTWSEVNRPRLKEPTWLAFPEMYSTRLVVVRSRPSDLHKGDTGFAETLGAAMVKRFKWDKSPMALYRAVAKGQFS